MFRSAKSISCIFKFAVIQYTRGELALIILGIDPGYAILGYGVIDAEKGKIKVIDYGVIETSASQSFPKRLDRLYNGVNELIKLYSPSQVAFEELFFSRNVTTALSVGAGRGVAMLCAEQAKLPLYEYTPMQIKLAVTGNGRADKKQMQTMVKMLLGLKDIPKPDDAADALGVAICHAHTLRCASNDFLIK